MGIEDMYTLLNHFMIIYHDIKNDQVEEDLGDDLCSWECFNTNQLLTTWRQCNAGKGVTLLIANAKPELDFNEFARAYRRDLTELKIMHCDGVMIKGYPWFFDQEDTYDEMREAYRKILNGYMFKGIPLTELCNYKGDKDD